MRNPRFILILVSFLCGHCSYAQLPTPKPRVQPSDCVTVKYPLLDSSFHASVQINPQGTDVAYLIKAPNLESDRNDIELYITHVPVRTNKHATPVLIGEGMTSPQWLGDGRHLAVLMKERGRSVVALVETATGHYEVAAQADTDISEYSISSRGDRIVFSTEHPVEDSLTHTTVEAARGYRIPFPLSTSPLPSRNLYYTRRVGNGRWSRPVALRIRSPFTGVQLDSLRYQQSLLLSLSPNGASLLIRYMEPPEAAPTAWREDPYVKSLIESGYPGVPVMVRYELDSDRTTIPLATPWEHGLPLWSPDSKAFVVYAQSPVVGGALSSIAEKPPLQQGEHLYWVDVAMATNEIAYPGHVVSPGEQPLFWRSDGTIYIHATTDTVAGLSRRSEGWATKQVVQIPKTEGIGVFPVIASDGNVVIGEQEGVLRPPAMFQFGVEDNRLQVFQDLNPQFEQLTLATIRDIRWTATSGKQIQGRFFLPRDYRADQPYPLVIQTKPGWNGFACDTGISHFPSFAPQPIAAAGILYLQRIYPDSFSERDEKNYYPHGYPGGVSEAAYEMGVWDGAIDDLSSQGTVDKERVGIIGFSRSGWYTEFSLAHSSHRYRAATVTDNVQYSVGTYWLLHTDSALRGSETMYGGPPYGETLKNWQNYSISFNLDKIHTPLLMEALGHGMPYNDWRAAPSFLATMFEVFTGLNKLNKPVELFYYPNEDHQPDHPQARLATLQRNLDWYRFWLQGYERPHPEDTEQYIRWRKMRGQPSSSR